MMGLSAQIAARSTTVKPPMMPQTTPPVFEDGPPENVASPSSPSSFSAINSGWGGQLSSDMASTPINIPLRSVVNERATGQEKQRHRESKCARPHTDGGGRGLSSRDVRHSRNLGDVPFREVRVEIMTFLKHGTAQRSTRDGDGVMVALRVKTRTTTHRRGAVCLLRTSCRGHSRCSISRGPR